MTFYSLEKLHKLSDGYREVFQVGRRHLLLLQIDGQHHIIDSACPHLGASLAMGELVNNTIRCPLHSFLFDLKTGKHINEGGISCEDKLIIYKPVYRDDVLGVEI